MPHAYWVITFNNGCTVNTSEKAVADNALGRDDVRKVIFRALTVTGWKETRLK